MIASKKLIYIVRDLEKLYSNQAFLFSTHIL